PATQCFSLSLHDALPICPGRSPGLSFLFRWFLESVFLRFLCHFFYTLFSIRVRREKLFSQSTFRSISRQFKQAFERHRHIPGIRSEEHTSELQSRENLVC